jgi:hypothetical protein
MALAPPQAGVRRWWHSRFGAAFAREFVLIGALLLLYKYGRFLVSHQSSMAVDHAREVIDLERALRIFTEERVQDLVVGAGHTVEWLLNAYYLFAHVLVTAAAFFWLYTRHPHTYVRFRRVMVAMTVIGFAIQALYPLAPPRMFPHLGFVDTGATVGPASYGRGSAYQGFANQFAAMPSLHFGWALAVAWAAMLALRSPRRRLALLHPLFTLAAVVLTANHYWLDAIVAAILFGLALRFDQWRCETAQITSTPTTASARARGSASSRVSRGSPIRT